jgi:hypothetical protein
MQAPLIRISFHEIGGNDYLPIGVETFTTSHLCQGRQWRAPLHSGWKLHATVHIAYSGDVNTHSGVM